MFGLGMVRVESWGFSACRRVAAFIWSGTKEGGSNQPVDLTVDLTEGLITTCSPGRHIDFSSVGEIKILYHLEKACLSAVV